jgi:hypothetical protein
MNVMSEPEVEAESQAKGLNALRLTPADIDTAIKYVEYWVVPNTTTTVCAMILQNNYVLIGTSAAVSMANFDQEIGRNIAYGNAREQIWHLEGYLLKQKLYEQGN